MTEMQNMNNDYASISEAPRWRNVSRRTIYNAIRDNKIASVEFAGRIAVFAAEVAALQVYPAGNQRKGITMPGGRGRSKGLAAIQEARGNAL